ncbi:hypothetical protein [Cellulomonas alba]|uniref:Uncharacterized protein n=1 Tax=Cellulomonas alba TaxID=3053467 RepID=A0ABT7SD80_9CELL|nr:hypothetical protein [Cellulomonas alba]MDM7853469.1 hypothetical protein [Cellulomonas alba]
MITTTGQRTVEGCTVFLDDTDALTVYVMPQSPHIALDADGKPLFSLVQYRRPLDKVPEADRATKLGGGLLTFSVDLARTAEQEAAIRKAVAADPQVQALLAAPATDRVDYSSWWATEINGDLAKLAAALKISAVPVETGSVAVAVDGEPTAGGEFVTTLVGAGKASMTGDERAAFVSKLTLDGAALLWDLIDKNMATIWVGYEFTFTSRLDGVTMICHADTLKTFNATQEQWQDLSESGSYRDTYSDSSETHSYSHASSTSARDIITKIASDTGSAWVKVIPSASTTVVTPEMLTQLTTQGWTLISNFLADKLLAATNPDDFKPGDDPTLTTQLADGGGGRKYGGDSVDSYKLKKVDETTSGNFDARFDEKATVTTTLAPNDNLSNILQGRPVSQFCTRIDLDPQFFRYVDVEVSCTADFVNEPVDVVKAHLEYHGVSGGNKIDAAKDLEFTKDATGPQIFSTYLAAPDQTTFSYAVDVFYRGSTTTMHLQGKANGSALVLDTDTLGILAVDLQVGIVDWTRFKAVQVDLTSGTASESFVLTSGAQSATWVEVVGAQITAPYTYQVTWVDLGNQQIAQPPAQSTNRRLVLDQPERESLSVTLVPAGSFGEGGLLSKIVTALRYLDPANSYQQSTTITMAGDGDVKTWDVPLVNPALRSFDYQVNVFYSDGLTRSDDTWITTDRTVLPVGDPYGWRVQFLPYLLKNAAGSWAFASLHVSFTDAEGHIAVEQDFPITDFTAPVVWRFRLAAPERHEYTYQLTLYTSDQKQVVLDPVHETKEVVVLQPPAAPTASPAPSPTGTATPPAPPAPAAPTPVTPPAGDAAAPATPAPAGAVTPAPPTA